jgi:hypothetical protein
MSLKTTMSKFIAGITTLLIITLCCGFFLFPTQRSGEEMFRSSVLDPMPKSVTILNSYNDGWDGVVWLHFKISPSDFDLILKSKNWQEHPDFLIGADTVGNEEVKDWWNARLLGDNAIKYYVVVDYDGHERIENIWVNEQRDEVYYRVTSIY